MTDHVSAPDTGTAGSRRDADRIDDDAAVIVVSNRQPYRHEWDDGTITVDRPTGGLTEGLDAAIREVDGSWVAWGDGSADARAVDDDHTVSVPPDANDEEQYTLERIWLGDDQVDAYYYGFSNRVLWPVCHSALATVHSEEGYWQTYQSVNERFADAVAERASAGDVVWLQDYHFALLPQMLQSRISDDVSVAHFWHIPWPSWDTFRACPRAEELLRGLLGNELLAVHVPRYQQNFLSCVDAAIPEAEIDWDEGRIFSEEGTTTVKAVPLGVDVDGVRDAAATDGSGESVREFAARHGINTPHLALGVDRLDYTKGIPERLDTLEHLWETAPEWQGELTFVQVGTESRSGIPAYRELQDDVEAAVERINDRFGTDEWQPVVYTTDHVPEETLYGLLRTADVGVVSPLRDGMNLVAHEFVAAQQAADQAGVLVLSDQAGIHDLLGEAAISVSPQSTAAFASGLETALSMPADERRRRMRALTDEVHRHDIQGWVDDVLAHLAAVGDEDTGDGRV